MNTPSQGNGESTLKAVFKLEKLGLLLGFFIDSLAVWGLLRYGKMPEGPPISSGLAFVIWLFAVYAYAGYLHHYWEKQNAEMNFSYYVADLIVYFRSPILLSPLVVLLVLIASICFSVDVVFGVVALLIGIPALIGCFVGLRSFVFAQEHIVWKRQRDERAKRYLTENWQELKELISHRLSEQLWVNDGDFPELEKTSGVTSEQLQLAFARYASENKETTRYAYAYKKGDDTFYLLQKRVLIDLKKIEESDYYYQYKQKY